jgi:hypothetical protein
MSIVLFNSNAHNNECRYLALSTHTRLLVEPGFTVPSMIGHTFNSVLDAYEAATTRVSRGLRVRIMNQLIEYRYNQDMYFRQTIEGYLQRNNVLVYQSDHPLWGGHISSDGMLVGQNVVGKIMMKCYLKNLYSSD